MLLRPVPRQAAPGVPGCQRVVRPGQEPPSSSNHAGPDPSNRSSGRAAAEPEAFGLLAPQRGLTATEHQARHARADAHRSGPTTRSKAQAWRPTTLGGPRPPVRSGGKPYFRICQTSTASPAEPGISQRISEYEGRPILWVHQDDVSDAQGLVLAEALNRVAHAILSERISTTSSGGSKRRALYEMGVALPERPARGSEFP